MKQTIFSRIITITLSLITFKAFSQENISAPKAGKPEMVNHVQGDIYFCPVSSGPGASFKIIYPINNYLEFGTRIQLLTYQVLKPFDDNTKYYKPTLLMELNQVNEDFFEFIDVGYTLYQTKFNNFFWGTPNSTSNAIYGALGAAYMIDLGQTRIKPFFGLKVVGNTYNVIGETQRYISILPLITIGVRY